MGPGVRKTLVLGYMRIFLLLILIAWCCFQLIEWITEGILLTTISGFGFFGNALSIYVLLRPSVRGTFSNILTGLATFDAAFLVLAILTFGLPTIAGDFYRKVVFPPITPLCMGLIHTFRDFSAVFDIAFKMPVQWQSGFDKFHVYWKCCHKVTSTITSKTWARL